MGYAFISYSSRQQRQMAFVKTFLQANGIRYWAAPEDIPIGSKYSEVIKQAIENASCVIFLLSDQAQNSVYCNLEISLALKAGKPIIPIQLEDVILNEDFARYLSGGSFFPFPRSKLSPKDHKLRTQLLLLCSEQDQLPTEAPDPSYKILFLRKGTWLQLFGWLWGILGLRPFFWFSDLLFPLPDTMYVDYSKEALVAGMYVKQSTLVLFLLMVGLLCICYGFSLNRKKKRQTPLYFEQFSLPQLPLLLSAVCFSMGFPLVWVDALYPTGLYDSAWIPVRKLLMAAWPVLLAATVLIWLVQRLRRRRSAARI